MKLPWKWIMGFILIASLLTACNQQAQKEVQTKQASTSSSSHNDVSSLNWRVPDFNYTDQNGQSFGMKDLKGKVWLTDFIFTRCPNICPPMTANMANVQKALQNAGVDAQIVSFSVDPDYDNPDVLKKYADSHHANQTNWHFLTGYPFKEVQKFGQNVFKAPIQQVKSDSPEVPVLFNHPSYFYLIDQTGKVVKFYDGLKPKPQEIVKDVQGLLKQ